MSKMIKKNIFNSLIVIWGTLSQFVLFGCKGEDNISSLEYNPELPVKVTSFVPETGGMNTQLVIYGDNFGSDISKINVKIGGYDAKLINAKGDCLYCFVPKHGNGKIEVKVGDSDPAVSEADFKYEYKQIVSTLCGYIDERGYGKVLTQGSFDELEKLELLYWFSFDPQDHNILYCCQDTKKSILKFDLKNRYMTTIYTAGSGGINRVNTIDWTKDGDMVVATANSTVSETTIGGILLEREENFSTPYTLIYRPKTNALMYSDVSDRLLYTDYTDGKMYSYDFNYWESNGFSRDEETTLFTFTGTTSARLLFEHPTGDYIYIVVPTANSIMRSDYNREENRYMTPYIICGGNGEGYSDLVGVKAKLDNPCQGVFVKNPEYSGNEDEYDFYFCDTDNHCIRKLTPNGVVSTFAGRGSKSLNGYVSGYVDGDLREDARFDAPSAIAYDEDTKTFYIGDKNNYRIRKISYEDGYLPESAENDENDN